MRLIKSWNQQNLEKTYKAEENIQNLEKDKKGQDLFIDKLSEQLKRLHEEIGLYDAQIASQRRETESANQTLSEASSEMELIQFEKKQLMQQWKTSLIQLTKRDEALIARDSLKEATDALAQARGPNAPSRPLLSQARPPQPAPPPQKMLANPPFLRRLTRGTPPLPARLVRWSGQ